MSKKRVHELAKEYGLENKDVLQALQQAGMSVKTHSSSVYEDEARAILDRRGGSPVVAADAGGVKPRGPGLRIVKKKKVDAVDAQESHGFDSTLEDAEGHEEGAEMTMAPEDEAPHAEPAVEPAADHDELRVEPATHAEDN